MIVYCIIEKKEVPFNGNSKGLETNIYRTVIGGQRYLVINNLISIHVDREEAVKEVRELPKSTDLAYIIVERQLLGAKDYTIKMNLGQLDITTE